jgi:ribosome biogenesis GTPase / thiamine phosphate phosphatase
MSRNTAVPPQAPLARVVESYGRRAIVETATGDRHPAVLFGKRLQVVCGDRVRLAREAGSDEWQITAVEPRRTVIARTDNRGRTEPLAANVTLLAVMAAPEPEPDLYMIDRYLAGAGYAGVKGAVLINKADIEAANESSEAIAAEFVQAGYPVVWISALSGSGLDEVRRLLKNETTLLVGQSGVGKSTLCNALVPASSRPTRALSSSTGEGTHTTVSAALLPLPGGGELVDSPGVRDFAPAPVAEAMVQTGWPEISSVSAGCRFNNCLHLREPGCAVQAAVEAGTISRRRFEGYRRLVNLLRQLQPSHERPQT